MAIDTREHAAAGDPSPDLRLASYFGRFFTELFQLDSRTWRSLRLLALRPGRLAARQVAGDRQLVHPIRLYLSINVVFFFAAPLVNTSNTTVWQIGLDPLLAGQPYLADVVDAEIAESPLDDESYRMLFDARLQQTQGALVAVMIPIVALFTWMVLFRKRRYLVEHLIWTTNVVAATLVSLLLLGLSLRPLAPFLQETGTSTALLVGAGLVILAWLVWLARLGYRAARDFFGTGRWWSLLVTAWLSFGAIVAVQVYTQALFWLTLARLRQIG